RGRAVAAAVVRSTQVRATLEHLAGNPDPRLAGVVACGFRPAARIFGDATGLRRIGFVLGGPPVGGPLPHVADHVVDAVGVWRKSRYGRGPLVTVVIEVLVRELALPRVGHMLAARRELIPPRELGAIESAPCGELPFGFGGQFLAGPFRVGFRVAI